MADSSQLSAISVSTMASRTLLIATALLAAAARVATAQPLNDVRKLYDSGEYQRAIETAGASQDPQLIYVTAQSQQKLRHADEARRAYDQLAARAEGDPWRAIGRSGAALLSSNAAGALQEADRAVES